MFKPAVVFEMAPEKVRVTPLFTLMLRVAGMVIGPLNCALLTAAKVKSWLMATALVSESEPARVLTAVRVSGGVVGADTPPMPKSPVPSAFLLLSRSVRLVHEKPPEKVFEPERVTVPAPVSSLVNAPGPLMTPT